MDSREDSVETDDGNGSEGFRFMIGDGKLLVKLQIPADCDNKEVTFNFEAGEESAVEDSKRRICNVCGKVFSSGKALGGHMRVHSSRGKKKESVSKTKLKANQSIKFKKHSPHDQHDDGGAADSVKKSGGGGINDGDFGGFPYLAANLVCAVCGRSFSSQKSLSGHMRQHPERSWRGLRPPSSMEKNGSGRSCSSHDELPKGDGYVAGEDDDRTDLKEFLKGWRCKYRRGRRYPQKKPWFNYSKMDDGMLEVAFSLILLSRGGVLGCDDFGSESNMQRIDQSDSVGSRVRSRVDCLESDDGILPEMGKSTFRAKREDVYLARFEDRIRSTEKNIKGMTTKDKNRKKKMLQTARMATRMSNKSHSSSPATTPPCDKYNSSTSDKSFPSHQAFCGHSNVNRLLKNPTNSSSTGHEMWSPGMENGFPIHGAAKHEEGTVPRCGKTRPQIDLNVPATFDSGGEASSERGFCN